jgi:hypothetical protein
VEVGRSEPNLGTAGNCPLRHKEMHDGGATKAVQAEAGLNAPVHDFA